MERLPSVLADLHAGLAVDAVLELDLHVHEPPRSPVDARRLADLIVGGGFVIDQMEDGVRARRARTLADQVGPDMRVLVVGLNPSLYAADAGVGFARPGNRFWPAAIDAGLVRCDRDARAALVHDGVGMTDLAKRATARADEVSLDEFRIGHARVARLVAWLQPTVVCVLGVTAWRRIADRHAAVGLQPDSFGGRPVYVMPNTSGLNARVSMRELTDHLRSVRELAG